MVRYAPSLLDRLSSGDRDAPAGVRASLGLDDIKANVARDVEHLLNARCVFDEEAIRRHPRAARSVANFGMPDISALSLASPVDRATISRQIRDAITNHEPRLRNVRVELTTSSLGSRDRSLRFAIDAHLVLDPASEPVSFTALLQPSTQQYRVDSLGVNPS